MGFIKPAPVAVETRTPGCGCGFPGVRVRVSLKNPSVARAEPYVACTSPRLFASFFNIKKWQQTDGFRPDHEQNLEPLDDLPEIHLTNDFR